MPHTAPALAKLSVPRTTAAVRRERLLRAIDAAPAALWIAAPPGAGKTTLAATYAAACRHARLWYRLETAATPTRRRSSTTWRRRRHSPRRGGASRCRH